MKNIKKTRGVLAPLLWTVVLSSSVMATVPTNVPLGQELKVSQEENNQTIEYGGIGFTTAPTNIAIGQESNVTQEENNQSKEWYAGVGFTTAKAKCLNSCEDITYGFMVRVGVDFNEYIGVEARAIKTFLEYEQQEIEHYGIYAKPMYPITDESHFYGLLGYGDISTGDKIVYDDSGFTWGVGFQFNFFDDREELEEKLEEQKELMLNPQTKVEALKEIQKIQERLEEFDEKEGLGLFIDYQRLLQKSNTPDFDAINFGVVYNF